MSAAYENFRQGYEVFSGTELVIFRNHMTYRRCGCCHTYNEQNPECSYDYDVDTVTLEWSLRIERYSDRTDLLLVGMYSADQAEAIACHLNTSEAFKALWKTKLLDLSVEEILDHLREVGLVEDSE